MLIQIPDLLPADQVARLRQQLLDADWVDGRATAGHQAALAKQNLQLAEGSPLAREAGDLIVAALQRNPLFIAAALPLKVLPPMFNCYREGQTYGSHVDNAIRQVASTG